MALLPSLLVSERAVILLFFHIFISIFVTFSCILENYLPFSDNFHHKIPVIPCQNEFS